MRIIIDAYNVIRTNHEGKSIEDNQGNQSVREWFINLCRDAVRDGEEWVVVFDGAGVPLTEQLNGGSLTVRYAHPHTADEVIRELGENAVALHVTACIVSSDNEVRVSGCKQQDSALFIDFVIKRKAKGKRPKAPSKKELGENILKALVAQGHLARVRVSNRLADDLIQHISYLFSTQKPSQKMAREIEKFLRERVVITPSSDPQKEVFRIIRQALE
jgi:predicted RNA-binding protein with PIN domain